MKRVIFTLVAPLTLAFTALAPSVARADTLSSQTVPFAGTVANPCNGDLVPLTATFKFNSDATSDSGGGQHVKMQITGQGSSTAPALPSGSSYQFTYTDNQLINAHAPYPYVQNVVEKYHLISNGPAPNFFMHFTFHLTVNANGIPAVQNYDYDTTCT